MKTTPIATLVTLSLTLAFVDRAAADELPANPYAPSVVEQVADRETTPPREGLVLRAPLLESAVGDTSRLYRSGTRLQTAGVVLGVTGTVAAAVGLAVLVSADTHESCVSDGDRAALVLIALAAGGAGSGSSCHTEPDHGATLGGSLLVATGAGLAITGVILGTIGASRRDRALRAGHDPASVEPWVAPTRGGVIGGMTFRQ
jgi:hypothetical protein